MEAPLNEAEQLTLLRIERERLLASIRYNSNQCTEVYERVVGGAALAVRGPEGAEDDTS